jgi:hypothetical protein
MGTNYYHERELCDKCHNAEREHIGKSSSGWTFSFHATDEIRSFADWKIRLASGGRIVDEYGDEISLAIFEALVESKKSSPLSHAIEERSHPDWGNRSFLDPQGHSFSEGEFS